MEKFENFPLRCITSFKIGGPARTVFFIKRKEELLQLLKELKDEKFLLLGEATNVLVPDEGLDYSVLINRIRGMKIDAESIVVSSGEKLFEVVKASVEAGLSGMEELAGIPGTIGGAVFGNAGAFGRQLSDLIEWVEFWKEGKIFRERGKNLYFGYRDSFFKREGGIILSVALKLKSSVKEKIKSRVEKILKERERKLPPPDSACAGSFFKNVILPNGRKLAAGKLLEDAGVKGLKVGGAEVSKKHANFIINTGNAKAKDVLALAKIMKRKVSEKFNINLEEEVIILNDP